MPVSSYVLRCSGECQEQVISALRVIGAFEIGERTEEGMAIATATDTNDESERVGRELAEIRGVRGATLVYHSVEDLA